MTASDLLINESGFDLLSEGIASDGTVELIVIRPGEGRGRGNHYYSPEMLAENAGKFKGWPMYVDHLAPEARKAMGGLPRSLRDVGGVIMDAWWDESVPADGRFEQGAVKGRAKPLGFAKTLIEEAPELVKASISTQATGVKSITRNGKRMNAVEGIEGKGSVDWVTEAGAGGQVIQLMESFDVDEAMLDTMDDDEFVAHVRAHRPHLLEALASHSPTGEETDTPNGEEDMAEITLESLREALDTDEGKNMLLDLLREDVLAAAQDMAKQIAEQAVESEREIIRAEANAAAQRPIQLRDMRDHAHRMIDEAKLPEAFAAESKARFSLDEDGTPSAALNLIDDVDENFEVTKAAATKLTEAVNEEISRQRELVATVAPTRVRGQGASASGSGENGEKTEEEIAEAREKLPAEVSSMLQESGFDSPDKVYVTG